MYVTRLRCRFQLLLIAVLAVLIGCSEQVDQTEHAHSDQFLRLTGWSSNAEAFVEHPPMWAGRNVGFIIYVTDVSDGSARTDGAVTLHGVSSTGNAESTVASKPMRPGVFAAVLTLPEAGEWKLRLEVDGIDVDLGTTTVHPDEESAHHAPAPATPNGIEFLKEQQWRLGIRTEFVEPKPFEHVIRVPATVVAPPDRRAEVSSPLNGRLDCAPGRNLPLPGDMVTAGETLAVVHPLFSGAVAEAAGAEAAVVRAVAANRLAMAELTRVRTLAGEGSASQRRLQEAEAEAERTAADLSTAKRVRDSYRAAGMEATSETGMILLTSQVSGVITEIHASLGERVSAGEPILTVLDPSIVWLRGRVPEADMLQLGDNPTATYRLPGTHDRPFHLADDDGLVYLSHEVNPVTRTAPIIFHHVNRNSLRVGMAVELLVRTSREEHDLVIPHEALVDEDGKMVVFVQLDGETFEKRLITIGGDDGLNAVVRSGLLRGERIVVNSPYSILLAQAGTSVPAHGHAH